jgi:hypothetical protein
LGLPIRLFDVQRVFIVQGIDGDSFYAKLCSGSRNANGYLAPVGD